MSLRRPPEKQDDDWQRALQHYFLSSFPCAETVRAYADMPCSEERGEKP